MPRCRARPARSKAVAVHVNHAAIMVSILQVNRGRGIADKNLSIGAGVAIYMQPLLWIVGADAKIASTGQAHLLTICAAGLIAESGGPPPPAKIRNSLGCTPNPYCEAVLYR